LKERAWFDVPIIYEDGRRAILAFEKGSTGKRAFDEAFAKWQLEATLTDETAARLTDSNHPRVKISTVRQLYDLISPEVFQFIVSNGGSATVSEITIGNRRQEGDKSCPPGLENYSSFKKFSVALAPGDSVTLQGQFDPQAKLFCVIDVR
jgi:hypothetical protein